MAAAAGFLCLLAAPAGAQVRPMPRPEGLALLGASRPMPRPAELEAGETQTEDGGAETAEAGADENRAEGEGAAGEGGPAGPEASGPLCGDPSVRGERVEPLEGEGPCGIVRPVRVEAVAGVALEPAPTLACPAVRALGEWLTESAKPAFAAEGAPLVGLGIAAGYVCRGINYDEEGEISEHGRGLAIDISRFERERGEAVTVLEGWESEEHGPLLRGIHAGACGIFATALGPASDQYHQDHFHYDAAERRRAYCPASYAGTEAEEAADPDEDGGEAGAGEAEDEGG